MKQLVSILIPAFNAEKWIRSCIESALAQTWPWKEIIVVDDGSKDSTFEIAKSYSGAYVHVITQENRGAGAARNHALTLSRGDYIQWLDADDLLAPDKITMQLNSIEEGQNRVLLSGAWGTFYHCPERSKFTPNELWQDLYPLEWLLRQADENLWMAIDSWLVSRRLTEMAGPWNESLSLNIDGEYFSRVILCSSRIKFISEARCYIRRGNPGISSTQLLSDRKLESIATVMLPHIRTLIAMEASQRMRAACLKLLQRWYFYFYPERPDIISEMNLMAKELGGQLNLPKLKAKYWLLQKAFGWRFAKKSQFLIPKMRSILEQEFERLICLPSSWKRKRS